MPINALQMTNRRMKTLVIAIAALTIAACARGLDSYGYVPPATLTPGLDQCLTPKGETKRCDQAGSETTRPRALTISPDHLIAGGK